MSRPQTIFWFFLAAVLAPADVGVAQLPSGTWQLQWADEFSLAQLDTMKWSYNYPWGNTHNHDAYMDPDNVVLGDGTLTLRAERVSQGGKPFTSGAVSTGYTKFTTRGGYIEARIRLPDTPGSWPAFWGLYSGWPPEADIMEYPIDTAAGTGYAQDQYHTAFHYTNANGDPAAGAGQVNPASAGDLGGGYHNFGMKWVADTSVAFYFDGAQVSSFSGAGDVAEMQYMYLILNYAVGGWPGTPNTTEWPAGHTDEMKVDWVRVWKEASASATNWSYTGTNEYVQWDTAGNWSNGSPNLGGVTANFVAVTPAEQRLDWSGIRTVTNLNFTGATRYIIGLADDRLLLVGANNAGGNSTITVQSAASNAQQEIRAATELWSSVSITNNSDQPLVLSGQLMGDGGANVDGVGVVIFAANNLSTGGVVADSGSQGPGTVRATSTNAFGSGTVTIGTGGNSTTGRVEVENNITLPNAFNFNGRNNSSVGILNRSGDNTLAGTISIQAGGGQYLIQSDVGMLRLTGAASGAGGVALRAGSTGARTLTLQGNADGIVSGTIENGAGVVSLIKSGSGSWTLSAADTYTGTTIVSQSTLLVNGATGLGLTTVNSGATLGGTGNVAGGLSAAGTIAPGNSAGVLTITGNATFAGGSTLAMELGGTSPGSQYDRLVVAGQFSAGGNLNVSLIGGYVPAVGISFDLLDWTGRTGGFANLNLPSMPNRGWDISKLYFDGVLSVTSTLPGDFSGNGIVDAADYVVWRSTGGTPAQYDLWRSHFGESVGNGALMSVGVPEPQLQIVFAGLLILFTGAQTIAS